MIIGPPSDDILRELGEVAVASSALEFQVAELAHVLLDEDQDIGLTVTTGMTFEPLLKLVDNLVLLRLDRDSLPARHFPPSRDYAMEAMRGRNDLLHGHWVQGATALANMKRTDLLRITSSVDHAAVRKVSDALHAACTMFWYLWWRTVEERGFVGETVTIPGTAATGHPLTYGSLERHESRLRELRANRAPRVALKYVKVGEPDVSGFRSAEFDFTD